jgi:hypothetical protein
MEKDAARALQYSSSSSRVSRCSGGWVNPTLGTFPGAGYWQPSSGNSGFVSSGLTVRTCHGGKAAPLQALQTRDRVKGNRNQIEDEDEYDVNAKRRTPNGKQ